MDARRERELFRLLSGRDRLSRPEKEAIFDAVVDALDRPAPQATRARWFALGIAVALALVLAFVLRPGQHVVPDEGGRPSVHEALVERGVGDAGPQLTLLCGDRPLARACPPGTELGFEVAALGEHRHVAMFATRPDGAVIWYMPAAVDASTQALASDDDVVLVPHRVELGPEHVPGRYEITAVFSAQPLTREDVKAAVREGSRDGIAIVERELWVQ
jgi:hypothetical protein